MKNLAFVYLAMITCTQFVTAQPTITSSVFGSIGDTYTQTQWSATGFDIGASGANVTWDFSDITITGPAVVSKNVNPAATPYGGAFGLATIAVTTDDLNYSYFQVTPAAINNLGAGTAAAVVSYSNPETILTFPLTYDSNSDDTFSAMFTSLGYGFERSGTSEMEADAYGTLILPTGTYSNVLRVKLKELYSDVSIGLPVTITIDYNFESYYWFAEGILGPILYYGNLETTTIAGSETAEVGFLNDDAVAAIHSNSLPETLINVYPNPATENVFIDNLSGVPFEKMYLYDITGQLILSEPVGNPKQMALNVVQLPAGIYTVQLAGESGTLSKLISIE
ncbi:MAG: T9SS type A sorting domain-containing protein, partial [Chitinophagales bacterium]